MAAPFMGARVSQGTADVAASGEPVNEVMNVPPHRVSGEMLAALATGGGGAGAVRHLAAAQYSKHLLLVWAVRDAARRTRHPQAGHASRGYDLLAEVQRHAPDAAEAVLRHPSAGAWAARALRALLGEEEPGGPQAGGPQAGGPRPGRPGGEPAQLAALAAAAAIRARYPCAIEVPVYRGVITLPSVGQVTLSPGWMAASGSGAASGSVAGSGSAAGGMANVRYTAEGTGVIAGRRLVHVPADTRTDAPGWRGLRQLRATERGMTLRLVLDDLDPDRMPSARDLGGRLSPAEATRWQRLLPQAWDLLADLPGTAAEEIHAVVRVLTPLRRPAHGQVSSSSREAFGGVALSPPADALALAVSLAQEAQHAKLGALLDLVTLTEPDDGQRYDAPWCDHPRCADAWCEDARRDGGRCDGAWPAGTLLQRAYGCLGVSGFWRWQCEVEDRAAAARARIEFRRWRDAAATATRVLEGSGRLTAAGRLFVGGMAATLQAWAEDEVPRAALSRARAGPGLPRNQLTVSGRGVRMRDETTVPPGGTLPPGVPPPGGPPGGVLPGGVLPAGVLPAGVTAGRSAARGVTAGGVFRSRVPSLAGLRLGDLDRCGRARLATAARRIVTPGGER
ncbi:MAG TPA: HEXXH motif-containing putative peptide modification protein [Streptosporangiaceae bacterium]